MIQAELWLGLILTAPRVSGFMNLYEVTLHGTECIYLLAANKYRALELVGDYFADAGQRTMLNNGKFIVRQVNLNDEQILRPEKCRACPLNE